VTRRIAIAGSIVWCLATAVAVRGERAHVAPAPAARPDGTEQHHYSIGARIRPLVVFWITRNDVGDAVVTRRHAADEARYSLLIGTDPARTPLHINRWGYIEEEIRGTDARLLGVMTESDEESIEQAESNVRTQASGRHPFKVIRATADSAEALARVASIQAPQDYTVRQIDEVLDLAERAVGSGRLRVISLPAGTRPGFLAALADAMHTAESTVPYAYYGRLYDLRRTHSRRIPSLVLSGRSYGAAIAADFVVTSRHDGEQTKFSMTYGTDGAFAEVPLTVTYQPRWWMQIELTIADGEDASGGGTVQ
jgi:hypothetical protein